MTRRYEKFYGPEKDRTLFRADLREANKGTDLAHLVKPQVAESLKYLDDVWQHVPDELLTENPMGNLGGTLLARARDFAHRYTRLIESFSTSSQEIDNEKPSLDNMRDQLVSSCRELQKSHFLAQVYKNRHDLAEASKLLEILASLNQRLDEMTTLVASSTDGFNKRAQGALEEIQRIAQSAKTEEEKAKALAEEQAKQFQNYGVSAFGDAFRKESVEAKQQSFLALGFALSNIFVLVALYGYASRAPLSAPSDPQFWMQMLVKVVVAVMNLTLAAYFLKERRNFLHVAVANRHRSNLCTAYAAISQRMGDEEKLKYLSAILPEISSLGKTGFITKEDVSLLPTAQLIDALAGAARKKKGGED